jgi:NlpC/P60 family
MLRPGRPIIFLAIAIFACGNAPFALSQSAPASVQHVLGTAPANQDGGLTILSAALQFRHVPAETDCSHLVHDIYERAGFPYSYLTSRQLFAGSPPFVRVKRPQPGDVVVWPGHAGIVVSPKEHTFYAAFTSGLGVERYDSDYWRRRGHPRFFRYIKIGATLRAASSPEAAPVKTFSDWDTTDSAVDASRLPAQELAPRSLPRNIVIGVDRPAPLTVQQAALHHFARAAEILNSQITPRLAQSVVIFDEFQVRKVHVKGSQGWADVRINEPSSLVAGQVNLKRRTEKKRWLLSRLAGGSWELIPPAATIYLSRSAATRSLAHWLAVSTEESSQGAGVQSYSEEQAGVVRVLAALMEQRR